MTLTTQFYTMLAMVGMGSWLGASLDTYGRFQKRPKRSRFLVFINDWLFWIFQGLIIFYVLLLVNKGELRFYIFVALLCGYAFYQSLLKSAYLRLLEFIINISIRTYKFLTFIFRMMVIKPIQFLIQLVIMIVLGLWKTILILLTYLLKLFLIGLKILFAPIKFIFLLIWRLIPVKYKYILQKFFRSFAGFFQKVKNIKTIIINWWNHRRK